MSSLFFDKVRYIGFFVCFCGRKFVYLGATTKRRCKPKMTNIGNRIKKYREDLKMTLPDLAAKAGVSKSYLWQLEEKKVENPTLDILVKIAEALDKTVAELTHGEPLIRPSGQPVRELPASLKKFIEQQKKMNQPLTEDEIRMLAGIHYRGKRPTNIEDWQTIYQVIKSVSKK